MAIDNVWTGEGDGEANPLQVELERLLRMRAYREATALLMHRFGDRTYRYAAGMTQDRDLAEEVRQQVFLEVHRDLSRSAAPRDADKWVFGITRHRCFDAVRARSQWRTRYKNDPPPEAEPIGSEPSGDLHRKQLADTLGGCLAREAVLLRYQQDLSYEAAAHLSGQSATALRQRVTRSMPLLRKCIETVFGKGARR
jgi:RNA polymerase sigma-70 factor (ECF subfamily)